MIIKTESNTYSVSINGWFADRGPACVNGIFELFCPASAKMLGAAEDDSAIFEMTAEEFAGALKLLREYCDKCRSFGLEHEVICTAY